MKKVSLLQLVCLLILSFPAFGQLQMLRDNATGVPITANPFIGVKGSPYLGDFEIGDIIFSGTDTASNVMIAFNAYNHTLEYKHQGELLAFVPGKIQGFAKKDNGSVRYFRTGIPLPGIGQNRFVEVLEEGNYSLVRHTYKVMVDDVTTTYGTQKSKSFEMREDLYVLKDGNTMLMKTKKKNLQEIFGSDFLKVEELVKKHQFDLKSANQLKSLLQILNTL
jgi:hypothetical protein